MGNCRLRQVSFVAIIVSLFFIGSLQISLFATLDQGLKVSRKRERSDTDHNSAERRAIIYADTVKRRQAKLRESYGGDVDRVIPWDGLKEMYLWDWFPPMFNCPWRERVGKFGDGGKVVCNPRALQHLHVHRPCVIYSFGVRGDISFEYEILSRAPKCTIYAFDPTVAGLPRGIDAAIKNRIVFTKLGLGGRDDERLREGQELRTLATHMKNNGHTHIDLLKVDVEGSEWACFLGADLSMVDQVQIELHFKQASTNKAGLMSGVKEVFDFFEHMENSSLYPFSWEVNHNPSGYFGEKPYCIEYSFVRPSSAFMKFNPSGTAPEAETSPLTESSERI